MSFESFFQSLKLFLFLSISLILVKKLKILKNERGFIFYNSFLYMSEITVLKVNFAGKILNIN